MSCPPSASPIPDTTEVPASVSNTKLPGTAESGTRSNVLSLEAATAVSSNAGVSDLSPTSDASQATPTPHQTKWAKHRKHLRDLKTMDRTGSRAKGELVREFSQEQAQKLLRTLEPPFRDVVGISFRTGISIEELLNLTRDHVNYEEGEVFVSEDGDSLARYVGLCDASHDIFKKLKEGAPNSRYIFCHEDGTQIRVEEVEAAFLVECETLGLQGQLLSDITWSYAAWLVDAGFPGPVIAARLGVGQVKVQYRFTERLRKPKLGLKDRKSLSLDDRKARGLELEKSREMTLEKLETFIKL